MRIVHFAAFCSMPVLAGCGGSAAPFATQHLTVFASVNGGPTADVTQPRALNLPNVGDAGIITAFEGAKQVSFSLTPAAACAGIVTISPATSSTRQRVTATATGQCTASVIASGGATASLSIFSMPPP